MAADSSQIEFRSSAYFPALDGLRAFCVFLVMFNHTHLRLPPGIKGWLGVDIFFILSGFLITTLLLREREKYGNISLKGFYTRRFFRIVPVYLVVLLSYVPIILLRHDWQRWTEFKIALPYLLTFIQEFRPSASGTVFGQSWTLGFEEKFYVIWPLLAMVLYPFRKRSSFVLALLGTIIVVSSPRNARCYGGLLLGSILAIVLNQCPKGKLQDALYRMPTIIPLAVLAGGYYLGSDSRFALVFSAGACLLTAVLVLRRSLLRSVLENRFVVLIGKRSYAMYLVHVLVLNFVEAVAIKARFTLWYIAMPVAFGCTFLAATVLYYLVERPSIEYGRKLSKNMREKLIRQAAQAYRRPVAMGIGVDAAERSERAGSEALKGPPERVIPVPE